ncbi:zf-HC2 domain-containing protein [Paenibacillus filicis]|uniref:Anti-sigma-W factor RsiW n=1 Tax=Paenibacillus gyeongsangnamensis TaxID=3388067 RepID=A0ABT4QGB7_9BACL|nr:zf-HC2 domain-containing protein [Paenibacillus filicis]MCZ8515842.1 zf-HC2 domain-containing protein [Paenibacillus filicis]
MNCYEALPMLHEYLDGGLDSKDKVALKEHLLLCADCRKRLQQLEKVEALIVAWEEPGTPDGLTERIMQSLPPVKRVNPWYRWVRRHPAASVAAVFVLVMFGSFLSMWNNNRELLVRGSDLQSIVIQGKTVLVPEGRTVAGDLTVEEGNVQVNGVVKGNVVVIDGSVNMASTAHISGQVKQIDEAFSWMWYKMNLWFNELSGSK